MADKVKAAPVYLTAEQIELIERVADYFGVSRSNFMRIAAVEKANNIDKLLEDGRNVADITALRA